MAILHVVSPLFFVLMNCVDMYMYGIDSLLYYYMLSASNESSICFQWFFTRNYAAQILTFFSCTLSFLSYQRIRNSRILFNFISLRIKMNYAGSDSLFSFKSLFYNVEKIIIEINLDDSWKMKLKNNILPFDFFFSLTLITDHTLYVLKYIKVKCKREDNGR